MSLSSLNLDAFMELARAGSFSLAAKRIFVTQSALSQRVQKLEDELEVTLVVRESTGVRLTPAGEDLLRYCQTKSRMEQEVLNKLSPSAKQGTGSLRIAGFSSVMRSVILPALKSFLAKNGGVQLELMSRELRDLPKMLSSAEVDFIVTTQEPSRSGIASHLLGYERNVLVEGVACTNKETYFDHDAEDRTTHDFLSLNGKSTVVQRAYLDEIYAIIDAVRMGLGRAVVPEHLIARDKRLKIVKGYKALKVPVRLQYFDQPYYTQLLESARESLLKNCGSFLGG